MPYQKFNYAGIPPHIINGPLHGIDFGDLLKKGMQLRHEPQRLLEERQQAELSNRLGQQKSQFNEAELPFAQENARNESLIKAIKGKYAEKDASASLQQLLAQTGLTKEQIGVAREKSKLMARTPTYSAFGSAPIREALELREIGRTKGFDSPDYREAKASVERSHEKDETKHMTAEEKHDDYMRQLRDMVSNPNIPQAQRDAAQTTLTQNESRAIIKANGQKVANQLSAGIPMQQSVKKLITRPFKGYNKKTGEPVYDNSPLWYLTLYSGVDGKARLAADIASRSPNVKKHKAAESLASTANGQFTSYNKLSVQPTSEKERYKVFNPSSLFLGQAEAFDAAMDGLSTLTMEHQSTLDEARTKAGLPLQKIDVMGKKREIPSEYSDRQQSGQNYRSTPEENINFIKKQQKEYNSKNSKNTPKDLFFNGSDFQEGGF